jgi:acyl-CoA-binding protein
LIERGYESYYVRAVDPGTGHGLWLRHTVHAGDTAMGSVWITLFGDELVADKWSLPDPVSDADAWLRVGDSSIGPGGIHGPGYDLTWTGAAPPLRHLPAKWMYRAPLPKTKPESLLPLLALSGTVTVGDTTMTLDGWPGMLGHNWGVQHAERWIWLHGVAFEDAPEEFVDLVLGRVRIGPVLTPWIINGVAAGRRFGGRVRSIVETPLGVRLAVSDLELTALSDPVRTAVWRYADPDGSEHHVANCSVARLEARVGDRVLRTEYGGTYELGMRETTHGLPVLPFPDP